MKILLDNHNEQVASVVNICCERTGADLAQYSADASDYDLIIKDYKNGDDVSNFDLNKTLFLVSKTDVIAGVSYTLSKPFSPLELIGFISEFSNQGVSEQAKTKMAQEFVDVSSMMKEIDAIDKANESKSNGDFTDDIEPIAIVNDDTPISTEGQNFESLVDNFYNSSDDVPLSTLAENIDDDAPLSSVLDNINDDAPLSDLVDNIADDIPLSEISLDDLDDDKPLSAVADEISSDEISLDDIKIDDIKLDINLDDIKIDDDAPLSAVADEISVDEISDDIPLTKFADNNTAPEIPVVVDEPKEEKKEEAKDESNASDFDMMFSQIFDSVSNKKDEPVAAQIEPKDDEKPLSLASDDDIPLANIMREPAFQSVSDESERQSEPKDDPSESVDANNDDDLLFDSILSLEKDKDKDNIYISVESANSDEASKAKVETINFYELKFSQVASGIEILDAKPADEKPAQDKVELPSDIAPNVSVTEIYDEKNEIESVLAEQRKYLNVADELRDQMRDELEANIARAIERFSTDENVCDALKDLKININISFGDK